MWRRQNPKQFDPRLSIEITREQVEALSPEERTKISMYNTFEEIDRLAEALVKTREMFA